MQARDHPVLLAVPETYYLKCFVLRKSRDVPASALPGDRGARVRFPAEPRRHPHGSDVAVGHVS